MTSRHMLYTLYYQDYYFFLFRKAWDSYFSYLKQVPYSPSQWLLEHWSLSDKQNRTRADEAIITIRVHTCGRQNKN